VRYRLYQSLWIALDWVFPPNCGGCGKLGIRWCPDCNQKTRKIESPICHICGQQISKGDVCHSCKKQTPSFEALRSWAVFEGPIRECLHKLKYRGNLALGEAMSRPLIDLQQHMKWDINMVIPVPLGEARYKERGYNQASLLAKPLALKLQVSNPSKALIRKRETPSQVNLNREQRKTNVADAFKADPDQVFRKSILVIDDVTTSGSTLDSCASALRAAGAENVYGLTLARAELTLT
jgi:ComF family protein